MFNNGQLTVLNIKDILPNRFQPRIKFDEEKLEELADSISKYGVIQPIVVRPVGNKFEIIAGERRFKASKLANRSTIPAILVNLSDKDSEEIALLENVQRQQLSPIEEAVSYKRILDMGYITQEELARKIGKSQSTIANKIRLLNLDDEVQSYLLNNRISERHARSLLRIPDKEKQVEMLHRIVDERLTVKQTDKEIAKLKESEKKVQPIDLDISVKSEPIMTMEKPTVNQNIYEEIESLFDDEEERGNNMDIDRIMREAKDINGNVTSQPKDISNLMTPSGAVNQPSQPMPEVVPLEDSNLEANKFINVSPQPEVKEQPVQPANNGVTFDSVFNQHITQATPTVEPQNVNSTVAPNINSNQSADVTSNVAPSFDLPNVSSEPIENSVTADTSQVNPPFSNDVSVTPEPVSQSVAESVTPISQENVSSNVGFSIPEVDVNLNSNDAPNIYANPEDDEVSPDTRKVISSAVASALKKYNENKARNNLASTIPTPTAAESTVQASQPVSNTSNIPDMDIIADNTLSENMNVNLNVQPTMASTITQDVKPVSNQSHFADIVKMLRDCANKIEQSGYYVNVDELDIGNQYKVTFTINKD